MNCTQHQLVSSSSPRSTPLCFGTYSTTSNSSTPSPHLGALPSRCGRDAGGIAAHLRLHPTTYVKYIIPFLPAGATRKCKDIGNSWAYADPNYQWEWTWDEQAGALKEATGNVIAFTKLSSSDAQGKMVDLVGRGFLIKKMILESGTDLKAQLILGGNLLILERMPGRRYKMRMSSSKASQCPGKLAERILESRKWPVVCSCWSTTPNVTCPHTTLHVCSSDATPSMFLQKLLASRVV